MINVLPKLNVDPFWYHTYVRIIYQFDYFLHLKFLWDYTGVVRVSDSISEEILILQGINCVDW
jgi:hypothetical protein